MSVTHEPPAYREELRRTLVDDLFRRSATTVWFLLPALLLFREIVRPAYEAAQPVRVAFWCTVSFVLARWGLVLAYRRAPQADRPVRLWANAFFAGTFLMGLGLAGVVALAGPHLDLPRMALVAVFLTGVDSVALGSMAASPRTYAFYMVPPLAVVVGSLGPQLHTSEARFLVAMIVIYLPVLPLMCFYAHQGLRKIIVLGFELRDSALNDVLTGLRNRRFLAEFMLHESERTRRGWNHGAGAGMPAPPPSLGVLLVDLDRFKAVNDEHGHAAGDEVLRQFAGLLAEVVRKPDFVVRWGGEEFVVIARDVVRAALGELAERIRRRVEGHTFHLVSGASLRCTTSIGFALHPFSVEHPHEVGWEQVLALADHALYRAKESGRNRVAGLECAARSPEDLRRLTGSLADLDEVEDGLLRWVVADPGEAA